MTQPFMTLGDPTNPIESRKSSIPGAMGTIRRFLLAMIIFASGLGSGYVIWGQKELTPIVSSEMGDMVEAVNPESGIVIRARFQDVRPKLLSAGAIDLLTFQNLYQQAGRPLTESEIKILKEGSQEQVIFNRRNAYFLLNYFWALGLTNRNPILDVGPIQQASNGQIDRFASTGGWTNGAKPAQMLFSSSAILSLTPEQQAKVDQVAKAVYRPCCDNPTHFPDCNHGMAMLGMLELMASQDASVDEMFTAAKSANAFWFPQQTVEQALYFKSNQKADYSRVDAKMITASQNSSSSGFQNIHQWLADKNLLDQLPKSGSNCGV